MIIDKSCKIEKACSKDFFKPQLNNPYFNGKRIISSDGHKLAVIPAQATDDDVKGFLPVDAIKASRKARGIMTANGTAKIIASGRIEEYQRPDENPVDYIRVLKPAMKAAKKPLFKLSINAKNLADLQEALGTENVVLCFSQDQFYMDDDQNTLTTKDAIFVETNDNERFGLIMPMKL